SVRAVNTTLSSLDFVEATAKVYDLDGRELKQYSQQLKSSLSPNSVQELFTLNFSVGNLARGAKVRASSTSRDAQRASAVTDGNGGTRWASEYNDAEWITLDLGNEKTFNEIVLKWEGAHATAYRILLSNDGAEWREVHAEQECKGGEQHIAVEPQAAQYVKVECSKRATQWGYSLYEIELYNRDAKTPQLSPVHFIRLELKDAQGKLLSDNFYWRATERGNYQALNTLAPAKIKTTSRLVAEGERKIIRTTVKNVGRGVAFAIHIQPRRTSDGERILPYVAEDNYITLLPGESRTLNFEFDGELLPDDRYSVDVEAYNR
ncbi:MAG: discoidin domain-containing protein, partial [Alistipes sp.]|nr:discoidin domain-containing protein [Alistipes sp.]